MKFKKVERSVEHERHPHIFPVLIRYNIMIHYWKIRASSQHLLCCRMHGSVESDINNSIIEAWEESVNIPGL